MAGIKITTDSSVLPVSPDLAKSYLRIDDGDTSQDELVNLFCATARDIAELRTNRSFIKRTYREYFDCFPGGQLPLRAAIFESAGSQGLVWTRFGYHHHHFELSRSPLVTVVQLQYIDPNGTTQTVDSSVYTVNPAIEPARITLNYGRCWPCPLWQPNTVWVDYTAGYSTDASGVPSIAKNAMLLLVNHLNENRDAVQLGGAPVQLPYTIDQMLDLIRVYYQP